MDHEKFIRRYVLPSAKLAYNLSATSAEVFCRHSFGQRYAPSILGSFLFAFVFTNLMRSVNPQQSSRLLDVYLLAFFILVLFHLGRMWRPRLAPSHSYSCGQSWPFWQRLHVRPGFVQTLVEPVLHILAGLLLMHVDLVLSFWLQTAGICLFVKEMIGNWKRRNRILDALDARSEGERMNEAIRQRTASQTAGEQAASPVAPAQQAHQPPNTLAQIVRNLDPALRQLISTPDRNAPARPAVSAQPNRPGPRRYHAGPLGTLPRITSKRPRQ